MSYPAPTISGSGRSESAARCASCASMLSGPYCSQCGEQVIDRHSLTVRHFLSHGLLHELTHWDGKLFRTFGLLLFRPGFLSQEYFAGRRVMYVNPVRLLLTAVVIFALAVHGSHMSLTIGPLRLSMLPPGTPSESTIEETISKIDVLGMLSKFAHWRGQKKDLASKSAAEKFNREFRTYGTALSFCNVGLLALFLFALYRRRRSLFLEHLVFSFHLAAFVLLFSIVPGWVFRIILLARMSKLAILASALLVLAVEMLYLYRALLRFYRPELIARLKWWSRPAWATRGAVVLVFIANSVFITITYAAGATIALLRV